MYSSISVRARVWPVCTHLICHNWHSRRLRIQDPRRSTCARRTPCPRHSWSDVDDPRRRWSNGGSHPRQGSGGRARSEQPPSWDQPWWDTWSQQQLKRRWKKGNNEKVNSAISVIDKLAYPRDCSDRATDRASCSRECAHRRPDQRRSPVHGARHGRTWCTWWSTPWTRHTDRIDTRTQAWRWAWLWEAKEPTVIRLLWNLCGCQNNLRSHWRPLQSTAQL